MIYVDFNGRLGADAELKNAKNGNQFLSMRAATDEFNGGERTTTWINVLWSGERSVKMAEYMKKGTHVSVHGTLKASTYKTKNGESAVSLDVFADRVDFVGSSNSGSTQPTEAVAETGTLKKQESAPKKATEEDDLPF